MRRFGGRKIHGGWGGKMTFANDPFIKMEQSVRPNFFLALFQPGLTCSSHKTGDGPFGLLVIQILAE